MEEVTETEILEHFATLDDTMHITSERLDFNSPHCCQYCSQHVVEGGEYGKSVDLEEYSVDLVHMLPESLIGAVRASKAGCTLYSWFLRLLLEHCKSPQSESRIEEVVSAQFFFEFSSRGGTLGSPRIQFGLRDGRQKVWHGNASGAYLVVSAEDENVASKYIKTRPLELDVRSHRSVAFAQSCLALCRDSHLECRSSPPKVVATKQLPTGDNLEGLISDWGEERLIKRGLAKAMPEDILPGELPTRLLKVLDSEAQMVQLVQVSELAESEKEALSATGFTALSYCWGGDQPQKLTSATLPLFKAGKPVSHLSKTIQDAMWYTVQLGMTYIWIDALCILQDSNEDKGLEIARMGLYYGANTVTLCAASAASSMDGFLQERSGPQYKVGPFKLPYKIGDEVGSVLLHEDFELEDPTEPTCARAWTLQESMLSRRILIFASAGLYWTCCRCNASCGGRMTEAAARNMSYPRSLVPGIFPIEVLWTLPLDIQWEVILRDFASRGISVAEDKLPAISALANHLHKQYRHRHGETVYLAGVFVEMGRPFHMMAPFMWFTDKKVAKRAAEYRAPTWSWACLDGPYFLLRTYSHFPTTSLSTTYTLIPGQPDSTHMENFVVMSDVVSHDVQLSNPAAPYGPVTAVEITVRAPLKKITKEHELLRSLILVAHSLREVNELEDQAPWLALMADTEQDHAELEGFLRDELPIYCLEVYMADTRRLSFGLVLEALPASNEGPKQYTRKGVYIFSCRDYWAPETERTFMGRESFLWDTVPSEVVLV
ncbi:hypothetical protein S7711_09414 [Stachybotrys chartarum IBT 7711]|uniref:Heterokaryon incompatibility domain-containing protein n=1 Tax=Stachybotrys chartarum (strain CBS 109288 / IBT 7711) TaxID=1280523 RepID=A0A084AMP1_STACB|nr:hypothetical protein S7711_09414 [Stachybotrys chartarum IBT 7711]